MGNSMGIHLIPVKRALKNYWLAPDNCMFLIGDYGVLDDQNVSEVWAGFDGTTREDITQDFQSDLYSRDDVYTGYKRYQWEGPAGKVAILRALLPNDSSFRDKLRTSYVAYLILRGPNFFFAPRFISPPNGVPISAYSEMEGALGEPTGIATKSILIGPERLSRI
jgi:hypothetical protein